MTAEHTHRDGASNGEKMTKGADMTTALEHALVVADRAPRHRHGHFWTIVTAIEVGAASVAVGLDLLIPTFVLLALAGISLLVVVPMDLADRVRDASKPNVWPGSRTAPVDRTAARPRQAIDRASHRSGCGSRPGKGRPASPGSSVSTRRRCIGCWSVIN
jgi:hypothetical protein